jgi:hypothetical protein
MTTVAKPAAKRPKKKHGRIAKAKPLPKWFHGYTMELDDFIEEVMEAEGAIPEEIAIATIGVVVAVLLRSGVARTEAEGLISKFARNAAVHYSNELSGITPIAGSA